MARARFRSANRFHSRDPRARVPGNKSIGIIALPCYDLLPIVDLVAYVRRELAIVPDDGLERGARNEEREASLAREQLSRLKREMARDAIK